MGIISGGFTDTCGKANFFTTVSVTVPGKVLRWIKSLKQKEIKECLRSTKDIQNTLTSLIRKNLNLVSEQMLVVSQLRPENRK